jgi:phosphoribosylamine-glycine ligase
MKESRKTVLVVDGGGRGAALVDKYAQSEHVRQIFAVPGNDLMKINIDKPIDTYPELKTKPLNTSFLILY